MDARDRLLKQLEEYKALDADEGRSREDIAEFVKANPECFNNDFKLGHITGSALVIDQNIEYTLLTYHPHIKKWIQFGGHSDGSPDVLETGFREAQEESGMKSLKFIPEHGGIFDLDIHPILPRGEMPLHNHYDIRIILSADKKEPFVVSHESKELKWIKLEESEKYNNQPAFLRLVSKAIKLKGDK